MTIMADSSCSTTTTNGAITRIQIAIEDNPYEDLLICLNGLCAWIDNALYHSTLDKAIVSAGVSRNPSLSTIDQKRTIFTPKIPIDHQGLPQQQLTEVPNGNVLVHCRQGVSRSGAVIIAYLMRMFSLGYDVALAVAQTSRSIIQPNSGFADQLRLWHQLDYQLFTGLTNASDGLLETKSQYEVWKSARGILLTKAEIERTKTIRKLVEDLATTPVCPSEA
jgi:protein tyrosine/serine phosphatase